LQRKLDETCDFGQLANSIIKPNQIKQISITKEKIKKELKKTNTEEEKIKDNDDTNNTEQNDINI
jgi:hypothetical protein